jgi:hypothetical protein
MNRHRLDRVPTRWAIEHRYSRLENGRLTTIHYFARGDEFFCFAKEQWYQIFYHRSEMDYGPEEGMYPYPEVGEVREVMPPDNVTYSHMRYEGWDDDEPLWAVFGGDMGANLCLGLWFK